MRQALASTLGMQTVGMPPKSHTLRYMLTATDAVIPYLAVPGQCPSSHWRRFTAATCKGSFKRKDSGCSGRSCVSRSTGTARPKSLLSVTVIPHLSRSTSSGRSFLSSATLAATSSTGVSSRSWKSLSTSSSMFAPGRTALRSTSLLAMPAGSCTTFVSKCTR